MAFFFLKRTYNIPGIYQWVKPNTAVGAGPFGCTYLQTIVISIGAAAGGASGGASNNQGASLNGGNGGGGGAYAQATFLPASLPPLADIVVGAGTPGGVAASTPGVGIGASGTVNSLTPTKASSFDVLISSPPGNSSNTGNGALAASITGGFNIINNRGGFGLLAQHNVATGQQNCGPGLTVAGNNTWWPTGNNGGAPGGSANTLLGPNLIAGPGGGVYPAIVGGSPSMNSQITAQSGRVAGPTANGGGGAASQGGVFPITGGKGNDAPPNSGSGGGGGGGASSFGDAGGSTVTSGAGGKGSDGTVQVVDIFTLPSAPPPYYFNFDLVTWYHMMNMARPISLTGRYAS